MAVTLEDRMDRWERRQAGGVDHLGRRTGRGDRDQLGDARHLDAVAATAALTEVAGFVATAFRLR
jgi:hypothetical protein